MHSSGLTRRRFLRGTAIGAGGAALAACGATPTPQVIKEVVTQVVEKVVAGTPQVVKETVVIQETVVVKETVVVEQTVAAPTKQAEVFMTWSWWGTEEQLERNNAKTKLFRDKFPYVSLQPIYPSDYNPGILTMIAGGKAPDVIMMDNLVAPGWFSKKVAVEITPYLDKDADLKATDYLELPLKEAMYGGKLYGLPTDSGPSIYLYNTTIVKDSGKPSPLDLHKDGTWTYDTAIEFGQGVTNKDKNIWFRDNFYDIETWIPLAWANGGEFFDEGETKCLVDSEPFIIALQYALDMKDKYQILLPPGGGEQLGVGFRSGNVAMMGCWGRQPKNRAAALGGNDKVQPAFVCSGPKGSPVEYLANSYVVSAQSKHPELGYELLKSVAGPEGEVMEQQQFGFIFPCTKKNYDDPAYWKMSFWDQSIQKQTWEAGAHRPPISAKVPWEQLVNTVNQFTDQVWMNTMSPKEACTNIATEINKVLEKAPA